MSRLEKIGDNPAMTEAFWDSVMQKDADIGSIINNMQGLTSQAIDELLSVFLAEQLEQGNKLNQDAKQVEEAVSVMHMLGNLMALERLDTACADLLQEAIPTAIKAKIEQLKTEITKGIEELKEAIDKITPTMDFVGVPGFRDYSAAELA